FVAGRLGRAAGGVATPADPLPPAEHRGHRAVEVPAAMPPLRQPRAAAAPSASGTRLHAAAPLHDHTLTSHHRLPSLPVPTPTVPAVAPAWIATRRVTRDLRTGRRTARGTPLPITPIKLLRSRRRSS